VLAQVALPRLDSRLRTCDVCDGLFRNNDGSVLRREMVGLTGLPLTLGALIGEFTMPITPNGKYRPITREAEADRSALTSRLSRGRRNHLGARLFVASR
jgi:hypothetical protein